MKLLNFIPDGVQGCSVEAWLHTHNQTSGMQKGSRPAVIVCPGGGYVNVSEREAEPVAREFFAAGYHTFILRYSVKEKAKDFEPLCQLAATIAHVRKNKEAWFVEEDKIAVCGFSAGAHLAGSLGTLYLEPRFLEKFGRQDHICPDAMILCYPVITSDEFAHKGSIMRVSGDPDCGENYRWFGLDQHVGEHTPPTFLWHTAEDKGVPVENSLKMAMALSKAKVPFEYHVFPKGGHGIATCTREVGSEYVYNRRWVQLCKDWLNDLFDFAL